MKTIILSIFYINLMCSCTFVDVDNHANPIEIKILDSMSTKIDSFSQEFSTDFDTLAIILDTSDYIHNLYTFFKLVKATKFEINEEKFDLYSFKRLKPIDLRLLTKNSKKYISRFGHDYEQWYVFQRSESKSYFSLYFFLLTEETHIMQFNLSKRDSSLISINELAYIYNGCEEYGYLYSKIRNDTLRKFEISSYDECSKDCIKYIDSTIYLYKINANGNLDSLYSKNFKIKSNSN